MLHPHTQTSPTSGHRLRGAGFPHTEGGKACHVLRVGTKLVQKRKSENCIREAAPR